MAMVFLMIIMLLAPNDLAKTEAVRTSRNFEGRGESSRFMFTTMKKIHTDCPDYVGSDCRIELKCLDGKCKDDGTCPDESECFKVGICDENPELCYCVPDELDPSVLKCDDKPKPMDQTVIDNILEQRTQFLKIHYPNLGDEVRVEGDED